VQDQGVGQVVDGRGVDVDVAAISANPTGHKGKVRTRGRKDEEAWCCEGFDAEHSLGASNHDVVPDGSVRASTALHAVSEHSENGLLSSGRGLEEGDLLPSRRGDGGWESALT
jgi:hypothetical protein